MENKDALNQEDKYVVYYFSNDRKSLFLGLIIIHIFIVIMCLFIPEFRLLAIYGLVILGILAGLQIRSMVRARGEKQPLLEMDQEGISNLDPVSGPMYLKWGDIGEIRIRSSTHSGTSLELVTKERSIIGWKVVSINLNFCRTDPETILSKAKEYKRRSDDTMPHEDLT